MSQNSYQEIRDRKLASIAKIIPQEWQIPPSALPSTSTADVSQFPQQCAILTPREKEITSYTAASFLIASLKKKRYTAVEVCTAFCKRAAIAHQLTNCITEPLFESALARAKFLDDHLARTGKPFGPLHGLPISVKDMFNIKGVDSSLGIASLCFRPATSNAAIVDILMDAGAVVHVKTNVPQTLMALDSVNNVFGRTLNPYNRQCWTAGGSSGGEGVLVAMSGSVFGVGTDIGGSVRIPAMCNGVVGFKPSSGRIPTAGMQSSSPEGTSKLGMETAAGVLARKLEDVGLFMKTVERARAYEVDAAIIPGQWWTTPSADLARNRRKPRIGILRHDALVNPLPPIHRVISEVEQKLQSAGIEIITLDHRISQILGATAVLVNQFFAAPDNAHIFSLLEQTGEPLIPWLGPRLRKREAISLEHLRSLFAHKGNVQQAFLDKVWKDEKVDAIICPVAPHPVPPLDRWGTANYTAPWVLFDYPAASLPVRKMEKEDLEEEVEGGPWDRKRARSRPDEENRKLWNRDTINRADYLGSPLGIQVVAPRFQERKLWDVMTVIKDVLCKGTEMMGSKL